MCGAGGLPASHAGHGIPTRILLDPSFPQVVSGAFGAFVCARPLEAVVGVRYASEGVECCRGGGCPGPTLRPVSLGYFLVTFLLAPWFVRSESMGNVGGEVGCCDVKMDPVRLGYSSGPVTTSPPLFRTERVGIVEMGGM